MPPGSRRLRSASCREPWEGSRTLPRLPSAKPSSVRAPWVALLLVAAAALVSASGCAHRRPPVQPWQREHLAKRALRFDADLQEDRFRQHWYGAREGGDLGFGQPGGGCGCN